MNMGEGRVVFSVLLVVLVCFLFKLLDVFSMFSTVGSSTERGLYLFGVTNNLDFLMLAIYDGDCGGEDDVDKLRLFLF